MNKTDLIQLQLEVETILIGLSRIEGWSSRVQADKIVDLVLETVNSKRIPTSPGPWQALACKKMDEVWSLVGH